jgi:hypothetical protein
MDDDNGNELDEPLDRNTIIHSLPLMARIKCTPITTNDALNDQLIFNNKNNDSSNSTNDNHQDKKVKVEEKEEVKVFIVGQDVLYSKNDITEVVKIISVHKDDWPNLYYTIKFDNGSEKQTIPLYLSLISQNNINLQADDGDNEKFTINVTHGKNNYIVRVKDSSTINDIKNVIFNYTGVPISKQKIIFKGKTLSNDLTVINCNITPNSKLMVMGSK